MCSFLPQGFDLGIKCGKKKNVSLVFCFVIVWPTGSLRFLLRNFGILNVVCLSLFALGGPMGRDVMMMNDCNMKMISSINNVIYICIIILN